MSRAILVMMVGRIFLLAAIIHSIVNGAINAAVLNTLIFFLSIFMPILGMHDKRYYYLDAFSMASFAGIYFLSHVAFLAATDGMIFGYDKLFHILGGMCVAWFTIITSERWLSKKKLIFAVLGCTLLVGVGWEIFEWMLGNLPEPFRVPFMGWIDSSWDLVADFLGAGLVLARQAFKSR